MLETYHKEVIQAYQNKKDSDKLPDNLVSPTDAKLKTECLNVFKRRFSNKDSNTFSSIFGARDTPEEYFLNVRASNADKFKSLKKYLIGETEEPQEKTIELLAWMIDFEPRPGTSYYRVLNPHKIDSGNSIETIQENTPVEKKPNGDIETKTDDKEKVPLIKNLIPDQNKKPVVKNLKGPWAQPITRNTIIIALVLFASGAIYFSVIGRKQCMYWTGDHYEAIACDAKANDAPIIALDEQKIDHLKRITRPDTLTPKDLSKIWYIKIKMDSIECYTDSGAYPLDTNKRLRPMTQYMYIRHILKKDSLGSK